MTKAMTMMTPLHLEGFAASDQAMTMPRSFKYLAGQNTMQQAGRKVERHGGLPPGSFTCWSPPPP